MAKPSAPTGETAVVGEAGAPNDYTAPQAKVRARESASSARYAHEDDPVRWIAHIKRLRAEGRDTEADLQVRRFRERYPATTLPPEALRRPEQTE